MKKPNVGGTSLSVCRWQRKGKRKLGPRLDKQKDSLLRQKKGLPLESCNAACPGEVGERGGISSEETRGGGRPFAGSGERNITTITHFSAAQLS